LRSGGGFFWWRSFELRRAGLASHAFVDFPDSAGPLLGFAEGANAALGEDHGSNECDSDFSDFRAFTEKFGELVFV
jgi:hypothetical protein